MFYLFLVVVLLGISIMWANAIEKSHDEDPNYKGDDFFGIEDEDQNKDNK